MKLFKLLFVSCFLFLIADAQAQELSAYAGFWSTKYYEDDRQIDKKDFINKIYTQPESAALWDKSKKQMTGSWVAVGVQVGFLAWQLSLDRNESQTGPLIGVLGAGIVSIGFSIASAKSKQEAILAYNRSFDRGTSLHFGPTHNGLGFALKF